MRPPRKCWKWSEGNGYHSLMGVYDDLGVRTIINVAGSSTRVGGALMPDENEGLPHQ